MPNTITDKHGKDENKSWISRHQMSLYIGCTMLVIGYVLGYTAKSLNMNQQLKQLATEFRELKGQYDPQSRL